MFVMGINQYNARLSMYRVVYSADTVVPKSAKLTRLSAVLMEKYNSVVKGLITSEVHVQANCNCSRL